MNKMYKIEYYDYNMDDQVAYISASSQEKAVDRLYNEYCVEGVWEIKEIAA